MRTHCVVGDRVSSLEEPSPASLPMLDTLELRVLTSVVAFEQRRLASHTKLCMTASSTFMHYRQRGQLDDAPSYLLPLSSLVEMVPQPSNESHVCPTLLAGRKHKAFALANFKAVKCVLVAFRALRSDHDLHVTLPDAIVTPVLPRGSCPNKDA